MSYRPYAAIVAEALSLSSKLVSDMANASGTSIAALQPVTVDSSGLVKAIDVSVDSDAIKALGLAVDIIPNGSSGSVITHGRLLNVSTSYSQGDYLYVGKDGLLTNLLPEEGLYGFVGGDYVIRIGMVVKNNATPANKDVIINLQIIGKL